MGNCTSSLETIPIPGVDGPLDETSKDLLMRALNSKAETEENMRKLIASNVDVNHKIEYEPIGSCYPLHIASKVGNANAVDLLLKGGANPNLTDSQGKTPLHWAAGEDHADVVDELLQAKPDVNVTSENGTTPLNLAIKTNNPVLVEKLLQAGASVTPDKDENPLVTAVKGNYVNVIMPLLKADASPEGQNFEFSEGGPACMLEWAETNGHEEIAVFLKEKFPEKGSPAHDDAKEEGKDEREGGDGAEDTATPAEGPPRDVAEIVAEDGAANEDVPEDGGEECDEPDCGDPDCGGEAEPIDEGLDALEEVTPEEAEAPAEENAEEAEESAILDGDCGSTHSAECDTQSAHSTHSEKGDETAECGESIEDGGGGD